MHFFSMWNKLRVSENPQMSFLGWREPGPWNRLLLLPWTKDQRAGDLKKVTTVKFYIILRFLLSGVLCPKPIPRTGAGRLQTFFTHLRKGPHCLNNGQIQVTRVSWVGQPTIPLHLREYFFWQMSFSLKWHDSPECRLALVAGMHRTAFFCLGRGGAEEKIFKGGGGGAGAKTPGGGRGKN